MEAKKVRKGVGIRFAPVRRLLDMQTTKRLQRSLASYFFPPPPHFSNPFGGRVETWEWKFGLRDTGFEVSWGRGGGGGGHWQWRFTKGDGPTWVLPFPVDFLCFNSTKILLVEKKWLSFESAFHHRHHLSRNRQDFPRSMRNNRLDDHRSKINRR